MDDKYIITVVIPPLVDGLCNCECPFFYEDEGIEYCMIF